MLKKRMWIGGLGVLLSLAMVFTACGSSSATDTAMPSASSSAAALREEMGLENGYGMTAQATESVSNDASAPMESAPAAGVTEERKIIKHCYMDMETMAFDQALADIAGLIEEAGGYIQNQNVSGRSFYNQGEYYERTANISARIPAEKLDQVAESVGGLCNVVSRSENLDDITDSYYDTQARLDTLQVQEERLLEILSKAETLEDIITLEQALSEVRYEIESLTAAIRRMDSQVTYSYLELSIQEVVEYNIVKNQPKTFWEKLQASGLRSLDNISSTLQGILFFVIEDLPVLLILLAIVALVVWIISRIVKKAGGRRRTPPSFGPGSPSAGTSYEGAGQGGFRKYPDRPVPPQTKSPEDQPPGKTNK